MLKEALGPDSKVVFVGMHTKSARLTGKRQPSHRCSAHIAERATYLKRPESSLRPRSIARDGHGVARLFPVEGGKTHTGTQAASWGR